MTQKDIEILLSTAETSLKSAHATYSGFKVAAALITKSGKIYTGANIENPSLMLTMCAERIAIFKGLTDPDNKNSSPQSRGLAAPIDPFTAIAIVSNSGDYCFPCGACRQMLYEFAPDAAIYLKSKKGIKKFSIEELFPHAFVK